MKDIKVIDTLREIEAEEARIQQIATLPFHPLTFFAEVVGMTRLEETAVSIEDIAKCFRHQFDRDELSALIRELSKPYDL